MSSKKASSRKASQQQTGVPKKPNKDARSERLRQLTQERDSSLEEHVKGRYGRALSDLKTLRKNHGSQSEWVRAVAKLTASSEGLLEVLTDRTDRLENSLLDSDQKAQVFLENATEGTIGIDSRQRIILTNERACTMFGYSRTELLDQKLSALIPQGSKGVHDEHVKDFFSNEPKRRPMGIGMYLRGRRKDGSEFPIEVGLSAFRRGGRWVGVAFVSDVTRRDQAEAKTREQADTLRRLTNRRVVAQEDESRRWARELHDSISQRLMGIAMDTSRALLVGEGKQEALVVLDERIRRLAGEVQQLSRRIHPTIIHDLGLVAALRAELTAFEKNQEIKTVFHHDNAPETLSDEISLCCFRIAQEALHNIRKHSGADRVRMALTGSDGTLTMTIEDKGDGFDLERAAHSGGLGLVSMQERALAVGGQLSIQSTPSKGTVVQVQVPLEEIR